MEQLDTWAIWTLFNSFSVELHENLSRLKSIDLEYTLTQSILKNLKKKIEEELKKGNKDTELKKRPNGEKN